MAQSYRDPNVNCDVGTFDGQPNGWERWCDCMFNKSDPNWRKCIQKGCGLWNIGGCDNPWAQGIRLPGASDAKDPINANVFMNSAPWTGPGSAARDIPFRGTDIWHDIASGITIYPADYDPIELWKTFNRNKLKWGLLVAKAAVIPFSVAYVANPPLIAAAAIKETADKNLDYMETLIQPALDGTWGALQLVLDVLGTGIGFSRPVELAGIVLQKFAKDQVDTHEIDHLVNRELKAFIWFFSQKGKELGKTIQDALKPGVDASSVEGFFRGLHDIADVLAKKPKSPDMAFFDDNVRAFCGIVAVGSGVAAVIAKKLADPRTANPMAVADGICFELFNFTFTDLQKSLAGGAGAIAALFNSDSRDPKGTPAEGMASIDAVFTALNKMVDSINFVIQKIGVAQKELGQLRDQIVQAQQMFAGVSVTAKDAFSKAYAAVGGPPPTSFVPATNRPPPPPPLLTPRAPTLPSTSLLSKLPPPSTGLSVGAAATGAAIGAAVGGPPGALIGGGAALLASLLRRS